MKRYNELTKKDYVYIGIAIFFVVIIIIKKMVFSFIYSLFLAIFLLAISNQFFHSIGYVNWKQRMIRKYHLEKEINRRN